MLAALLARAAARRGAPFAALAATGAAARFTPTHAAPTLWGVATATRHGLASLTARVMRPAPSSLVPAAARSVLGPTHTRAASTKQPKSGGAKMKSLSCWKRRFKVGATGLVRMRAGHRHKRSVKPPHVRRRLRTRTSVHGALAKKMVVRGFTRERLC